MPSNSGHYDEALLGSAPKPNREQLQEGYDPKLLENSQRRQEQQSPQPRPGTTTPSPAEKLRPVTAPIDSDPEVGGAKPLLYTEKPKPFWKTRKGMFIIGGIVLAAVIIAAVVGGVVGSRNSKKDDDNKQQPIEDSGSNGSQVPQEGTGNPTASGNSPSSANGPGPTLGLPFSLPIASGSQPSQPSPSPQPDNPGDTASQPNGGTLGGTGNSNTADNQLPGGDSRITNNGGSSNALGAIRVAFPAASF